MERIDALKKSNARLAMNAEAVLYIPLVDSSFMNGFSTSSRETFLTSFTQEILSLVKQLPYLPLMYLPIATSWKKLSISVKAVDARSARDLTIQGLLFILEIDLLFWALPTAMVLPGAVSMAFWMMWCVIVLALSNPLHCSGIMQSRMDESTEAMANQHRDERWLFVNSCATRFVHQSCCRCHFYWLHCSQDTQQKNIDLVSKTFGRAVHGVHNKR